MSGNCWGKNNLDRPAVIFQKLNIPTYVIWDSDEGTKEATLEANRNRYLLRLLGQPEEDWPCVVGDWFACFKKDLDTTLCEEIGAKVFDRLLQGVQDELGIPKKEQAIKNPVVIQKVIEAAKIEGKSSVTIESILQKIRSLKPIAGTS